MVLFIVHVLTVRIRRITFFPKTLHVHLLEKGFMLHYYEDDENYPDPMFSEYGDNATGEAEDQ